MHQELLDGTYSKAQHFKEEIVAGREEDANGGMKYAPQSAPPEREPASY